MSNVPEEIIVDTVYPHCGGSQFLTIWQNENSEVLPSPLFLGQEDINRSVLAGVIHPDKNIVLRTPLLPPHDKIILPPLELYMLRPEVVRDSNGRVLGTMFRVPSLFVQANQLLYNYSRNNGAYDYKAQVVSMLRESGRLAASIINRGIIRVRNTPCIMAHALELSELAMDEVGISVKFAEQLLTKLNKKYPLKFGSVWDLDGFPTYSVRFPVANQFGVQETYLRILPDIHLLRGRYIALNPFNLSELRLGDRDGDLMFALLRIEDVDNGLVEKVKRERVEVQEEVQTVNSCLTLRSILNPETLPVKEKLQKKMVSPDLSTLESRLNFIRDVDTRTLVAQFTIIFGWYVPRALVMSGRYEPQEAYRLASIGQEWTTEQAMDGRKGDSVLCDPRLNVHNFINILTRGKSTGNDLDFDLLLKVGVPKQVVDTLKETWEITDGNIVGYVSKSPVYQGLVVQRNTPDTAIPTMLIALKNLGVKSEELYDKMIMDLTCKSIITTGG